MNGAAEAFQELGWPVFPVTGKIPATANGFKDATTEPWKDWPATATGIGLATGDLSGIFVIDLDSDDAMESFTAMQDGNGGRTHTVCSKTARGYHLFFRMPKSGDVRNSAGKLGDGIDVRASGGYVVIPPSAHPSGSTYEWADGRSPDEIPIADAPAWLLELVTKREPTPVSTAPNSAGVIPTGKRNATLTSLGGALQRKGASREAVGAALHADNEQRCDPPLGHDEVEAIADSVARYEPATTGWNVSPSRVEFLTIGDLENRPRPEYLLAPVLPAESLVSIYGPPGCGKTFLALDWALSIGAGVPWAHRPVKTGPVVYVIGEGAGGLGPRIAAWRDYRMATDGPVQPDVRFVLNPVQLMEPEAVRRFVGAIQEQFTESPAMVVLDTLARCMVGGDENSAKDMGFAVAGADYVKRTLGCTVLILHHANVTGERERGSTALRGAVDVLMSLKKDESGLTLECVKSKDAEPFSDVLLRLLPHLSSVVVTIRQGVIVSGHTLTSGALVTLRSLSLASMSEGLSVSKWQEVSGQPVGSFYRYRTALCAKGFVARDREGKGALYSVTELGEEAVTTITISHSQGGDSNPAQPSLPTYGETV